MLIFGDDSRMCSRRVPLGQTEPLTHEDIYIFGMVAIKQDRWRTLREEVKELKNQYFGCPLIPVKWNIRDVKEEVEELYGIEKYQELLDRSTVVRKAMLEKFITAEPIFVIAANCAYSTNRTSAETQKRRLLLHSFANALERLCFDFRNLHEMPQSVELVTDWPEANDRKLFDRGFRHAWLVGEIVFGTTRVRMDVGPLKNCRLIESPRYSTGKLDIGIQCTDLAVGLTRAIWKKAFDPGNMDTPLWMQESFRDLSTVFRRDEHGNPIPRGIVLKPDNRPDISPLVAATERVFQPFFI